MSNFRTTPILIWICHLNLVNALSFALLLFSSIDWTLSFLNIWCWWQNAFRNCTQHFYSIYRRCRILWLIFYPTFWQLINRDVYRAMIDYCRMSVCTGLRWKNRKQTTYRFNQNDFTAEYEIDAREAIYVTSLITWRKSRSMSTIDCGCNYHIDFSSMRLLRFAVCIDY